MVLFKRVILLSLVNLLLETTMAYRSVDCVSEGKSYPLPRFYVLFWLSHILVYIFYLCPSFCPS